jgi:hypothetical protein
MKFQAALSVLALALALVQTGNAQSQIHPPNATVPPAAEGTTSATSQPAPPVATPYAPTYESTAPVYAIPPQNTPPPTTPGENP